MPFFTCYWMRHTNLWWDTQWIDPYWFHLNAVHCRTYSASQQLAHIAPPQLATDPYDEHKRTDSIFTAPNAHAHSTNPPSTPLSYPKWPHEVGWGSSHIEQQWWKRSKISPHWSVDSTQRSTRQRSQQAEWLTSGPVGNQWTSENLLSTWIKWAKSWWAISSTRVPLFHSFLSDSCV